VGREDRFNLISDVAKFPAVIGLVWGGFSESSLACTVLIAPRVFPNFNNLVKTFDRVASKLSR
jgi:hypothetical protein